VNAGGGSRPLHLGSNRLPVHWQAGAGPARAGVPRARMAAGRLPPARGRGPDRPGSRRCARPRR
jgi:hypothetical protein